MGGGAGVARAWARSLSDAVTRQIQRGYYGRELDARRPDDPKDEQRFAYPVYVVFLLAPWLKLPFESARWMFSAALFGLTALSVPLWLRLVGWRAPRVTVITLALLTTSSFAAVQGLKLQQLSLLVAALLALCAYCIVSGWLFAAGVCLALASIKPQLMVLMAAWLMLWTYGGWKQRQNLFWGFVASLGILAAVGEYLLPGWIPRFVEAIAAYERYTGRRLAAGRAGRTRGGDGSDTVHYADGPGGELAGSALRRPIAGVRVGDGAGAGGHGHGDPDDGSLQPPHLVAGGVAARAP